MAAATLGEIGAARDALRHQVCGYVRALRDAGEPPERALRLVKDAVEPALSPSAVPPGHDIEWQRRLLQDVVTWCIDEYFAA